MNLGRNKPLGGLERVIYLLIAMIPLVLTFTQREFASSGTLPDYVWYCFWVAVSLTFIMAVGLGLSVVIPWIRHFRDNYRTRKQNQIISTELNRLIESSVTLFSSHSPSSLRSYVTSLSNRLATNETLHPQLKALDQRLSVLADWHSSLQLRTEFTINLEKSYSANILDINRFYRDTSDVARELDAIQLPDLPELKALSEDRRIMAGNYARQFDQMEEMLERARVLDPSLPSSSFPRF